jgi:transposase
MYIGLDVHCKETVYVVQDDAGNVISRGRVTTTPEGFAQMLESVNAPKGTKIGLETGIQAWWVSRLLSGLEMEAFVIDAGEVRRKARRINQKSDKRDAFDICDGLRRGIYTSLVYVPDAPVQRLRRTLSRRRHFVKVSTMQVNGAKSVLRSVGLAREAASLATAKAWDRLLERPAVEGLRLYLSVHADVWRVAQEKVALLEEELREALKPFDETARRLQRIPGVGLITSATFMAVLGRPDRFPKGGRVVSYIGLVPSSWDTADTQRHGHITKRGSGELRAMLCEAAQHAARGDHPLNPYWRRVFGKQGYKRAVVAVAQRLARIMWRMWVNQEEFDVRKLNVVRETHKRTRTFHWRLKTQADNAVAA